MGSSNVIGCNQSIRVFLQSGIQCMGGLYLDQHMQIESGQSVDPLLKPHWRACWPWDRECRLLKAGMGEKL